jgi:hypothetical protein
MKNKIPETASLQQKSKGQVALNNMGGDFRQTETASLFLASENRKSHEYYKTQLAQGWFKICGFFLFVVKPRIFY